jgi:hypothetical protein
MVALVWKVGNPTVTSGHKLLLLHLNSHIMTESSEYFNPFYAIDFDFAQAT